MTTVSVIVPAYNAECWIEEAIGSVLAQSWTALEVIVVSDGSTDGTEEIVRVIGDPRIRLIRQENRGQSAAINRGVRESSGEFIKILDADDWLNPGHLAAQLDTLRESPGCVASCRWGYFVDHPSQPRIETEFTHRHYADPLEWLVDSLTQDQGMMGGWMWLIPRTLWHRIGGYDERLSLNNDFDFSIRLLLASSGVRFAEDAVYSYRKTGGNALSGSTGERAMLSAFQTTESGCRALLEREDSPRIRRICADRWQEWLYRFYPEHPELADAAEAHVRALGGSAVPLQGGRLLKCLLPFLGWKRARRLQSSLHRTAWKRVLQWKAESRKRKLEVRGIANRGLGSERRANRE